MNSKRSPLEELMERMLFTPDQWHTVQNESTTQSGGSADTYSYTMTTREPYILRDITHTLTAVKELLHLIQKRLDDIEKADKSRRTTY